MLMQNQPISYDKLRDILMEALAQNRQTPVTPIPRPNDQIIGQLAELFTNSGLVPGANQLLPEYKPATLPFSTEGLPQVSDNKSPWGPMIPYMKEAAAATEPPMPGATEMPAPEKTPIPGIDTAVPLPRGVIGAGRDYYHKQLQKLYPDIYNAQNNWQLPKFKIGMPFNNQNSPLYNLYMASLGRGRF